LLERLCASSDLSSADVAFCQQQRTLCLRDAGILKVAPSVSTPPVLSPANADCGPRALALVCQRLGVSVSVERLPPLAGTTGKGTSLEGLAKAVRALGLKAEGVQVSREALAQVETPAIAWVNGNHYIAVLAVQGEGDQGTALIHDPNSASEQTISQEQLLRQCSGYLLLVHR
jgi:ABC-type bacteriocin/lantibiotic exporter with double-glycine peptidase domain